ncbi:MAG: histidine kinase [Anaerolineales bacterium]|nr:histidine kinase [Anaerolineales bacterium]
MEEGFVPDDSMAIGQNAANIAAEALESLGREMIRQKALDIAKQIDIYLRCKPHSDPEDLIADETLGQIAVQYIGLEGYSAVHDTRGINIFHPNTHLAGQDLHELAYRFPQFWKIIQKSLQQECDGYYDWRDHRGDYRRKYMYCYPIYPQALSPTGLIIAVTTYIDEFLKPSREIRNRIVTLAKRVDQHNRAEHRLNMHLKAINEISCKINSLQSVNVNELLPYLVKKLRESFQYDSVRVFTKNINGSDGELILRAQAGEPPADENFSDSLEIGHKPIAWVACSGQPYLTGDMLHNPGKVWNLEPSSQYVRMALPIQIGSQLFGVIDVSCNKEHPFDEIDLYTAQTLADQLAIAFDNARLYLELREMAVVEERNRIAREIHDTLAQGFAGISMNVEIAKQALYQEDFSEVEKILDRMRALAREKLSEARQSVRSLRPLIDEIGELDIELQNGLETFSNEVGIHSSMQIDGVHYPIPPEIRLGILRICQEALTNVKKHAQAVHVELLLSYEPNGVRLLIRDDGIGFDEFQISKTNGFGLICMSERARLMGGLLDFNSQIGHGTEISVFIPVKM